MIYRGEDISKIAVFDETAVLFMTDESVIIVTLPEMDIVAYISCEELEAGHRLGEWLTMVYFFIAVDVTVSCAEGCPCRDLTSDLESSPFVAVYFKD